jgi:hypothetical protein
MNLKKLSTILGKNQIKAVWQPALTFLTILCIGVACTTTSKTLPTTSTLTMVTATPSTSPEQPGKANIEGIVVGGGDKSPSNRMDSPRTFIYEVRAESGDIILVTYIALPPSPAARPKAFRLEFHAGEIQIGDYLKAYGSFDPATLTLTVAEEGDFIETYPSKP